MYARIIIDIRHRNVDRFYDYQVPVELQEIIKPGMRVLVPFGAQKRMGLVVHLCSSTEFSGKTLPIISTYDSYPIINDEMFKIIDYITKTSLASYSSVFQTVMPAELKMNYQDIVYLIEPNTDLDDHFTDGKWILTKNDQQYLSRLRNLELEGMVLIKKRITQKTTEKGIVAYTLNSNHNYKNIEKHAKIIDLFNTDMVVSRKAIVDAGHSNYIPTLLKNNVLQQTIQIVNRKVTHTFEIKDKIVDFTIRQQKVYDDIKKSYGSSKIILLHGITGSGKTEIYLNIIEDILRNNKRALILVPEITLVAPMAQRLKSRFSEDEVAIINSELSSGQRLDEWTRILNDEVRIVLGTRSAVFAPINDLGVIIIDEEHDDSYYQTESVSYDTKEIAAIRSQHHLAPIILGSATPLIKTMYEAKQKKIQLFELLERPFLISEPNLEIVDMRGELNAGNVSMFSRKLKKLINEKLEKKEQIILLLNRKGFAPFVLCRNCGYVPKCPTCNISLTYYKNKNILRCHHCDHQEAMIKVCPTCQQTKIREVGTGIERVELELLKEFEKARVIRMDQNTTSRKGMHEKIWNDFSNYEYDILLGTQMVSKGLDFPKVTLVGVLMADMSLKVPRYDANEKTFVLLKQVVGRSGRATKGDAIIQTYDPAHYAISSVRESYQKFYEQTLNLRSLSKLPPFGNVSQILITGDQYLRTHQEGVKLKKALNTMNVIVLGPTPSYIEKLGGKYRFLLTIKYNEIDYIKLREIISKFVFKDINVVFDRFNSGN